MDEGGLQAEKAAQATDSLKLMDEFHSMSMDYSAR